jgi:hypothetical protein
LYVFGIFAACQYDVLVLLLSFASNPASTVFHYADITTTITSAPFTASFQ